MMEDAEPLDGRLEVLHGVEKLRSLISTETCFNVVSVVLRGIFPSVERRARSLPGVGIVTILDGDRRVPRRGDPCDRSNPTDDFDLRRGDATGPEAERNHVRLDCGLVPFVIGALAWAPVRLKCA